MYLRVASLSWRHAAKEIVAIEDNVVEGRGMPGQECG